MGRGGTAGADTLFDTIPGIAPGAPLDGPGFVTVECELAGPPCDGATAFDAWRRDWASRFTTPAGGTWRLEAIELPIAFLSGQHTVDVVLRRESAGAPGAILESIRVSGPIAGGRVFRATSVTLPTLQASTNYWIELNAVNFGILGSTTMARWPGGTAGAARPVRERRDGGAAWLPGGDFNLGFRVLGRLVPIVVTSNCIARGCVFNPATALWEYHLADEPDLLRVLYFGVHNHAPTGSRDCGSDVRKALLAQYHSLFATGASGPLRHAWRFNDAGSVAFVAFVGVPAGFGIFPGYAGGAVQQSNPFCNAGPVSFSAARGIHLGYDEAESPREGPNWNTRRGDSDFADLDPLRVVIEDDDEVSSGTRPGTLGVVQVVAPVPAAPAAMNMLNYPPQECEPGAVDLVDAPYFGYFGLCGDGSPALLGACVAGYRPCTPGSPCATPDGPLVSGRSYLCRQLPGLGSCFVLAPAGLDGVPGSECRGNNAWMRKVDGALQVDTSLGAGLERPALGGFHRIHMTTPGLGCRLNVAASQIDCLATLDPRTVRP
jgi:hypothetical protein